MKYFIVGGAGFIGSNLTKALLKFRPNDKVVVYDNLSSTKDWKFFETLEDKLFQNLSLIKGDANDFEALCYRMKDSNIVFHLASNPDISKAVTVPTIDFVQGTQLTQNILEAMRMNRVTKIIYASGAGVYGQGGKFGEKITKLKEEDITHPISTYGASKLAGECLITAYCNMFGFQSTIFRFANVVGKDQTHGVAFDFINKLKDNPYGLEILGSGYQYKSYIYVGDVVKAVLLGTKFSDSYSIYNVSNNDGIFVYDIARIVTNEMGLEDTYFSYTGSRYNRNDGGWKGDMPIVQLNNTKIIKELEWNFEYNSEQAITKSVREMLGKV